MNSNSPKRIFAWREEQGDVWTGEWCPADEAEFVPKEAWEMVPATDLAAALDELTKARADADTLRIALSKARDQGRDPDYCYDEEWEYTTAWDEWPDLMDGRDLTDPTPLYTLYKGPTKWVVRVPTDGEDSEVRLFDSEADARAALTPAQDGDAA
jgi:hypothetical protein